MKLFFAPEFSSLAAHIALLEAEFPFDLAKVDIDTKLLADGSDYLDINAKGQVPALLLDGCELLTENVAILTWIADHATGLKPAGDLDHYRLLEMLGFIASEIHKRFPIYLSLSEDAQAPIAADIVRWFEFLASRIEHGFLFGEAFSVADAHLFVLARGALALEFPLSDPLRDYVARIEARASVQAALSRERVLPDQSRDE